MELQSSYSRNTDDILPSPGEFVDHVIFFYGRKRDILFFSRPQRARSPNGFHLVFTLKANRFGSSGIISRIVLGSVHVQYDHRDTSHCFIMSVIFSYGDNRSIFIFTVPSTQIFNQNFYTSLKITSATSKNYFQKLLLKILSHYLSNEFICIKCDFCFHKL